MMDLNLLLKSFVSLTSLFFLAGCSPKNTSFDMLATSQGFQQASAQVNNKIDILWVVDNSGSMDPLQQSLVSNFNSFVTRFQSLGFDYKMAITTTDSYLAEASFRNDPTLAHVRDGYGTFHSLFFYITPFIPDIVKNFVTNATQGSGGSGDERAFQSLLTTMKSSSNSDFRRPGAYFAVIILSDEDDFSDMSRIEYSWMQNSIADHDYTNPNLMTIDGLISELDQLTQSTPAKRNYNVSAITVLDQTCQSIHKIASPVTIVGSRYMELATKTGGVLGSICDASYANSLNFIQQRIVEMTTQFPLSVEPSPTSIRVFTAGKELLQDAVNGWTYNSAANAIQFHGTGIPSAGAAVDVQFTPLHLR